MRSDIIFFFFQAEDGIRDLVRSRGLGDVYKRQARTDRGVQVQDRRYGIGAGHQLPTISPVIGSTTPVSYTHLTLPTSDLV